MSINNIFSKTGVSLFRALCCCLLRYRLETEDSTCLLRVATGTLILLTIVPLFFNKTAFPTAMAARAFYIMHRSIACYSSFNMFILTIDYSENFTTS